MKMKRVIRAEERENKMVEETKEEKKAREKKEFEAKKKRLSRWTRNQLENDIIRLWDVEKRLLKDLETRGKWLSDNNICSYCGGPSPCDCPFG